MPLNFGGQPEGLHKLIFFKDMKNRKVTFSLATISYLFTHSRKYLKKEIDTEIIY